MVTRVMFFRPTMGQGGADRVTLIILQGLDRERFAPTLVLLRPEGAFLADVPRDVRVVSLDAPRLAVSGFHLARLLLRIGTDVLFSTDSAANSIAVAAHRVVRSRARLVLSERSSLFRGHPLDPKRNLLLLLKKLSYGRADVVTAVSKGVADQLVATIGVSPARLRVVYNPMIEDDLAERAAEPVDHPWFSDGGPVIVACGRLIELKDYPTLLEAFAHVRARHPARLFVLGEGPLAGSLEARARAMGLGESVRFHGFDKNPFKYMARAHLMMHASRVEGLPGALIQAMGCGTPVVATDCDFGPREIIERPGHDGFLVPVGDAAGLARDANRLLDEPRLRERVSVAARRSAARFTVAASLARYEQAIGG